jgi:hypothetical protein
VAVLKMSREQILLGFTRLLRNLPGILQAQLLTFFPFTLAIFAAISGSQCNFLPLMDVNEWNNKDVLSVCFLSRTFVTSSLVHIHQKEKIAPEIEGKL